MYYNKRVPVLNTYYLREVIIYCVLYLVIGQSFVYGTLEHSETYYDRVVQFI